jgi:hypothetical protein
MKARLECGVAASSIVNEKGIMYGPKRESERAEGGGEDDGDDAKRRLVAAPLEARSPLGRSLMHHYVFMVRE